MYYVEPFLDALPRLALEREEGWAPIEQCYGSCIYHARNEERRVVVAAHVSRRPRDAWRVTCAVNGGFVAALVQLADTDYFHFPVPVVLWPWVNVEIMVRGTWKSASATRTKVVLVCEGEV